jgi:hypothetical protein
LLLGGLSAALNAQVRPRITRGVDRATVVRVPNSTHPAVALARDLGRAAPELRMDRMLLELQSSPEQEADLQQLLAEQQDPSSPRYQTWLTPLEFGERFGPAQEDLAGFSGERDRRGPAQHRIRRHRPPGGRRVPHHHAPL